MRKLLIAAVAALLSAGAAAATPDLFETPPVHALDISPDGKLLAVAHTISAEVLLFDLADPDQPRLQSTIAVGLEPTSVRFRTDDELWVVNQLSDSINRIDVARALVSASLRTGDEPADLVFAGDPQRLYVSISAGNRLEIFDPDTLTEVARIALQLEEPRALALSPDGATLYVAAFESGNRSTVLGGSVVDPLISFPPNAVSDPDGPYQGRNPPPNAGKAFKPALAKRLPDPPATSLIVQQDADGRWRDDNKGDWTAYVSGDKSERSGRVAGWTLLDHDVARLDVAAGTLDYVEDLMNLNMAVAVRADGSLGVVGTDAHNRDRFEPNLRNRFVDVLLARVPAGAAEPVLHNLNPQLPAAGKAPAAALKQQSLADPRALLFVEPLKRAFVVGQGSSNLVELSLDGQRSTPARQLKLPAGPVALAWHAGQQRLYVYSRFKPTLSVVEPNKLVITAQVALADPLSARLRQGQALLFDSQRTSATGHLACASCHVDARTDRLAWDLGNPAGAVKAFDQYCQTGLAAPCADWHPMKGPMLTQTLFDIVGKEPLHWRGDRAGLDEFADTFTALLGLAKAPSADELSALREYLGALTVPPDPYRDADNALPAALDLAQVTGLGTDWSGAPLGVGDARRGLELFTLEARAEPFRCASCHTLPSGAGSNQVTSSGGKPLPAAANGDVHMGISSLTGLSQVSLRIPALPMLYDRIGFQTRVSPSLAGFGFGHDGSMPTLPEFLRFRRFDLNLPRDQQDVLAFLLAFTGGDLAYPLQRSPLLLPAGPDSRSSHASLGRQWTGMLEENGPVEALALRELAATAGLTLQASQGAQRALWSHARSRWSSGDAEGSPWTQFADPKLPVTLLLRLP